MKTAFSNLIIITVLLISACTSSEEGPILVEDTWIREAPPGATAMAGYMNISNVGSNDLLFLAATSPDYNAIEIHRSIEKDGVWKMIRKKNIPVTAGSTLELKPGDYHLMLFTPKRELKQGDEVVINLQFSDDITVEVNVPVVRPQH